MLIQIHGHSFKSLAQFRKDNAEARQFCEAFVLRALSFKERTESVKFSAHAPEFSMGLTEVRLFRLTSARGHLRPLRG